MPKKIDRAATSEQVQPVFLPSFTPADWYWIKPGAIFASGRMVTVAPDDPDYALWRDARGLDGSPWPKDAAGEQTDTALKDVLAGLGVGLPRTATAKQLRYALNATGKRVAWEAAVASCSADTRDYWLVEPDPPETSSKMRRLAAAAGVDLAELYDAAIKV